MQCVTLVQYLLNFLTHCSSEDRKYFLVSFTMTTSAKFLEEAKDVNITSLLVKRMAWISYLRVSPVRKGYEWGLSLASMFVNDNCQNHVY